MLTSLNCIDRSLGPQLCRSFGVATRSSQCWDGVRERLNDISPFTTDSVDGQGIATSIHVIKYFHRLYEIIV